MKRWMKTGLSVVLFAALAGSASAGVETLIYPVPGRISAGKGTFVVSNGNFSAPAGLSSAVTDKVKDLVRSYAGVTLTAGTATPRVAFIQNTALHDQGYSLEITPFFPACGPVTGSFNGLHRESNFLAASQRYVFSEPRQYTSEGSSTRDSAQAASNH